MWEAQMVPVIDEDARRRQLRFLFQRPNGPQIEVRGAYRRFDPPNGFAYLESYDFSPF